MKFSEPRITELSPKKFVGMHISTSYAENNTGILWRNFMPHRNKIQHKINNDLISLQVFPHDYFLSFNPTTTFEKWALVEVENHYTVLEDMEQYSLSGGLYAVFEHKGMDTSIFQYIYATWIPESIYQLDNRPHFEILGEKYKQGSPLSEEEIWIPICLK